MSSPAIYLTVGSVGRAWAVKMLDGSGAPVDLTSASSPTFSMRPRGSTTRKVNNQTAIIGDGTYTMPDGSDQTFAPTDGVLIYQPVAADVDTDGVFSGQFSYQIGGAPVVDPGAGYVEIIIQAAV